jgi:hypothetical protein
MLKRNLVGTVPHAADPSTAGAPSDANITTEGHPTRIGLERIVKNTKQCRAFEN